MRVWRSIKSCGAATLRDGVYLLPSEFADKFEEILQDHNHEDGKAYIFHTNCPKNIDLIQIFDRNEEYLAFLNQFKILESELDINKKNEHLKQIRKLRKNLNHLIKIDYFPKPIQEQATKIEILKQKNGETMRGTKKGKVNPMQAAGKKN